MTKRGKKHKEAIRALVRDKIALVASRNRMGKTILVADDFDDESWVFIQHLEGTHYLFRSAWMMHDPKDKNFLWVFTEHQGYHCFAEEELVLWKELESKELPR